MTKNIVDALRRALQGPASTLAAGISQAGGSFALSLQPNSITAPGGQANSYQSTIDIASVSGFNGLVTLTELDNFNDPTVIGIPTPTIQVAPPSPGGDGLVPVNVNIKATTPSGQYSVTITGTSTNNGQTVTAAAVLGVFVGTGSGKCVNNNDCGTGQQCSGGQCYTCPIQSSQHTGNCVARDGSICKAETGNSNTVNACGSCYCQECTGAQDCVNKYGTNYCDKNGSCSSLACVNNECVCTDCKNTANPISVSCPGNVTACIDTSNPQAQTVQSQFTVTNTNSLSGYNIEMSVEPVGGNCSCCGSGPSLSTGGGYSIGPGGSQNTTITVPLTCASSKCYGWNIKITVALAISNKVIQTWTCPNFQVCPTTSACVQVQVACDPAVGKCGSGAAVYGATANNQVTGNCGVACGACPTICSACCIAGKFSCRVISTNGFVGNVTVNCSSPSACTTDCAGFPAIVPLTAGQTVVVGSSFVSSTQPGNANGNSFASYVSNVTFSVIWGSAVGIGDHSTVGICP